MLRLNRAKPWQRSWQYGNQSQVQLIQWYLHHQWNKNLVGKNTRFASIGLPEGVTFSKLTIDLEQSKCKDTDSQSWIKNRLVSIM